MAPFCSACFFDLEVAPDPSLLLLKTFEKKGMVKAQCYHTVGELGDVYGNWASQLKRCKLLQRPLVGRV